MELFFSNEMLMAYVEKITMQKITIDHSKNESGAFIQVQKWFIAKIKGKQLQIAGPPRKRLGNSLIKQKLMRSS